MRKVLVIDIETANKVNDAIAYDIGFAVVDRSGTIYETHSYMVAEMFMSKLYKGMMDTPYYADKLPKYWDDYKAGNRTLATITTIRRIIREVINRYGIVDIFAYNASFDVSGLNRTIRYLTQSRVRWFFPYGVKYNCIWHMATQTLCRQKGFFKAAIEYGWLSESGNLQTSAEKVYCYIKKDYTFSESHTGLEDVIIESEIMVMCFRQHKRMKRDINRLCWKIPQKEFGEYLVKRKGE